MNVKKIIRDNWKGVVVGIAIGAAGAFGGPIAGKAAGILVPKALEHVKDAPITALTKHESPFSKEAIKPATDESRAHAALDAKLDLLLARMTPIIAPRTRATLEQVAQDWGIAGRLRCEVVQRTP